MQWRFVVLYGGRGSRPPESPNDSYDIAANHGRLRSRLDYWYAYRNIASLEEVAESSDGDGAYMFEHGSIRARIHDERVRRP